MPSKHSHKFLTICLGLIGLVLGTWSSSMKSPVSLAVINRNVKSIGVTALYGKMQVTETNNCCQWVSDWRASSLPDKAGDQWWPWHGKGRGRTLRTEGAKPVYCPLWWWVRHVSGWRVAVMTRQAKLFVSTDWRSGLHRTTRQPWYVMISNMNTPGITPDCPSFVTWRSRLCVNWSRTCTKAPMFLRDESG